MRILFVDFDGVLITRADVRRFGSARLDPAKVAILDALVEETDAILVVSSERRTTLGAARGLLGAAGLRNAPRRVVGVTPRVAVRRGERAERGAEVAAWLTAHHAEDASICIVDDGDDVGDLVARLVQTDARLGLTPDDAESARVLLVGR